MNRMIAALTNQTQFADDSTFLNLTHAKLIILVVIVEM